MRALLFVVGTTALIAFRLYRYFDWFAHDALVDTTAIVSVAFVGVGLIWAIITTIKYGLLRRGTFYERYHAAAEQAAADGEPHRLCLPEPGRIARAFHRLADGGFLPAVWHKNLTERPRSYRERNDIRLSRNGHVRRV